MNASIAVLNNQRVVLASNMRSSNGEGPFRGAQIFPLTESGPAALMIFGHLNLLGVSWEVIIAEYRRTLEGKKLETLIDTTADFIHFVQQSHLFGQPEQEAHVEKEMALWFQRIHDLAEKDREVGGAGSEIIREWHDIWESAPYASSFTEGHRSAIAAKYAGLLDSKIEEAFQEPLTPEERSQLARIGANVLVKVSERFDGFSPSRLIFAGYGSRELVPSVETIYVNGLLENFLICSREERYCRKVDHIGPGLMLSFGRDNEILGFTQDIHREYEQMVDEDLPDIVLFSAKIALGRFDSLDNKERKQIGEQLSDLVMEQMKDQFEELAELKLLHRSVPLTFAIAMMGQAEMAEFAQFLVELPIWKARLLGGSPVVGESINVAVVSKTDGFTWAKRSDK